jgi:AhpD family alkylhydroperoxidase
MGHWHDVSADLKAPARDLREHIPEVYRGFAQMHSAAMAEGVLTPKVKELIALAIAVTRQCDGCIASHGRGVARTGATDTEVAEALGVAIMMNGGPGTTHAPRAWQAFVEFQEAQPPG